MILAEGRKSLSKSRNVQLPITDISQNENNNSSNNYISNTPISQDIRNRKHVSTSQDTINGIKTIRIYTSMFSEFDTFKEVEIFGNQTNSECLKDKLSALFGIDPFVFKEVFSIWVVSELFEVQIKPHHSPYELLASWPALLAKYVDKYDPNRNDEPIIMLRRNVHLSAERELEIISKNDICAKLLLTYAKESLLLGRIQFAEFDDLLRITAKLIAINIDYDELEAENWVRENLANYLPEKYCELITGKTIFGKTIRRSDKFDKLLSIWKKESKNTNNIDILRDLSECSSSYGACWFDAFVEKKTSRVSVKSLGQSYKNVKAKVAINQDWITIIEHGTDELLLLQNISEMTWQLNSENNEKVIVFNFNEEPSGSGDEKQTVIPIEDNNDNEITYFLMIFGHQTVLIDVLLQSLLKQKERSPSTSSSSSDSTTSSERHSIIVRKLNCDRLCLAKFENGTCKNVNGSLKSLYKPGTCIY
ncbi:unnamed protein product [Caenorhabditis angaria]|uniref:FERM domain-containing protein n=1 Tax=Caenorhabditis angaria TaxID=860376 RepID=A0A9P1N5X8_9PELO|nr:unnamed protein product [Caenorhabditis angaria]